ncbi:MAG TPA: ArsR family transcriptional regulator [Candidatus Syntrophoarchaeum butanivorans]|uniref:Transcriptional regulator n=1 Tax=Candidatus Syntropharchaeum butanivorans TaxID=1839936 RepID=A0A1F2P3W5_9EURY|nr:MAG: transcriptional regulator [Candidatus Syntrophoarchaeum butanivorans]RJS71425.1 MAG: ArsR family transcriptional regulator [Candidatus Syntrophoarchaeum sp. WYZ-LMO15]HDM35798.1 ArsR family transcriptional regulator [Candidatus Syntrophoarchaeum butanivorans]
MRERPVPAFDEKDRKIAEILIELGVKKNIANVIVFLSKVEGATSRDIEIGVDLRQPEVSITMRELHENKWVLEREIKRGGKGRPIKEYRLAVGIKDIVEHLEELKREECERAMENIRLLKELIE